MPTTIVKIALTVFPTSDMIPQDTPAPMGYTISAQKEYPIPITGIRLKPISPIDIIIRITLPWSITNQRRQTVIKDMRRMSTN